MAEFESPIVKTYPVPTSASAATGGPTLADRSSLAKLLVRAAGGTAAEAALAVGFGASRHDGDVHVWGQRPNEWLLVGPPAAAGALVAGLDRSGHVSVVDHTHARALVRLTGADAAAILAKICNLDLSDAMTPDGAVVSASVAKVTCDLCRDDVDGVPSYLVACDRSFAQYLFDAILDAGEEFGLVPSTDRGTSG